MALSCGGIRSKILIFVFQDSGPRTDILLGKWDKEVISFTAEVDVKCVVPGKIHTNPMEGRQKFLGEGGLNSQNFRSKVRS